MNAPMPATVIVMFAPAPAQPTPTRPGSRVRPAVVLAPEDLPDRKRPHPLGQVCVEVGFSRHPDVFGPSVFNHLFDD